MSFSAISLYSGNTLPPDIFATPQATLAKTETQTLKELLLQAESPEIVQAKPLNILLVGRTGAGKSSLINTLFQSQLAVIDLLPSTEAVQEYQWQTEDGQTLTLWDTPGYEQAERSDLREQVLDYASTADLLLLINPALDPALQMDADFLQDMAQQVPDLPTLVLVSQVDRLRPFREQKFLGNQYLIRCSPRGDHPCQTITTGPLFAKPRSANFSGG